MKNALQKILTPHQLEALNYAAHISLTANAGSGKTFVLSKRYLEIALNEDIKLRNIAAITFTDKAASELYKKIAGEVEATLNQNPDEETRKKLERIRRELVSANISTIHAFCIDILREFPVEAGLDANFRPIDENLSNELVELAIEEAVKSAFNNNDEENDLKYLIRTIGARRAFTQQLFSLIKNRKNVFEAAEMVYTKPVKDIAKHLFNSFLELIQQTFLNNKESFLNNLKQINDAALRGAKDTAIANYADALLKKIFAVNDPLEFIKIAVELRYQMCTQTGTIKKKGYLSGNQQEAIINEITEAVDFFKEIKNLEIPENHKEIELELAKFGKSLIRFFNKAVDFYEQKKSENSYLDFEDILIHTRKILKNESVRNSLSEKYKYLMIDEYQDTNEIQYHIFLPILRELQTGNLFVVGDEKQSIYMFRDAELEVFAETKRNIVNVSGPDFLLTLPDSFRMAPAICQFTNALFRNLFNELNELYNEVAYSEIVCARSDNLDGQVEILLGNMEDDSPDSETELIAKRMLKLIEEKRNEGLTWGDIAVLVRKRKSFAELENVFAKYRIPFSVVGGTGFYQRQSIYDIYNYFSFLLDENNDTALVGILRSPFFNLSDAQIFRISRQDGYKFWNKLNSYSNTNSSVDKITAQLKENMVLAKSLEPTTLLRKILSETSYLSVLASKANGQQELANLEKLINLTTAFYRQGFRTLYDYVSYLKTSIDAVDEEAQAAVVEESDSVKIMTLHQAKGLEYKAVFLFKCDDTVQKKQVKAKEIIVDKKTGILAKVPLNENYFAGYESAPVVNIFNHVYARKELAETKRLFYVGVTRAKHYLFITADYKEDFKYSKESFMGLLKQGLNLDGEVEKIKISSPLKFLRKLDDEFTTKEEKISIEIPVVTKIDEVKPVIDISSGSIIPEKIMIDELKDIPEGEIISASKLSAFNQCPLKYQLIHEYGFSNLMKSFKDWRKEKFKKKYEFSPSEEIKTVENEEGQFHIHHLSDVKGRIIHKLLQKEISEEYLPDFTRRYLDDELDIFEKETVPLKDLTDEILQDMQRFYKSELFNEIKSYPVYHNEFQIYCKEEDYFLYGIIDRLIIEKNRAIIVDFKTDDIEKKEISQRFNSYLTQLKFYSYITNRLFENIKEFELRIMFVKHPDVDTAIVVKKEDLADVKEEVNRLIVSTRNNSFVKNLNHCPDCNFTLNNNSCIIQ